jgi:hypothetical protein
MTVLMTDGLNCNTMPLTVQFRTLDTTDSTYVYNVQTDEVPRDLSALNIDAGGSSPVRRSNSYLFH